MNKQEKVNYWLKSAENDWMPELSKAAILDRYLK